MTVVWAGEVKFFLYAKKNNSTALFLMEMVVQKVPHNFLLFLVGPFFGASDCGELPATDVMCECGIEAVKASVVQAAGAVYTTVKSNAVAEVHTFVETFKSALSSVAK